MTENQVIARKYRPQTFQEVVGQEAIVTTLKNSISQNRLAHAYLFSGSHGTGKTTLARVFAKALNCTHLSGDLEPCGACTSCKEIASGHGLDVIEIDGASHRGIDDIRSINDSVTYAPSNGKYKIYIIDEVHMLTKEAFNALLKTLEEPPERVKFFFATTEAHKVPATILSRCQRFTLGRISHDKIVQKLQEIADDLKREVDKEALHLIATRADGGLRDAESLLDQLLSCTEESVSGTTASKLLGVMPQEIFFEIDQAGKQDQLLKAFEVAKQVYDEGKSLVHFVEMLTGHYRNVLLVKLSGGNSSFLNLPEKTVARLEESSKLYRKDQLLFLIDYLVQMQQEIRYSPSPRVLLENILLKVFTSHHRIPVDFLVKRLMELEKNEPVSPPSPNVATVEVKPQTPKLAPAEAKPQIPPSPKAAPVDVKPQTPKLAPAEAKPQIPPSSKAAPVDVKPQTPKAPQEPLDSKKKTHIDTVMQFAAVELQGTIQRR